ncbi:ImmA/IrrE family metallo-endopeptidase [Microvirga mediterraneensis]|uniref:ImmA/IrrE family metallo-endopeptidase n=1 Tax=Microvirga mediterraneensis TaxID=2754695 RepID=A0A838BVM5_9HYPH|nr:ImmA/IrrE family metallo-endopeptidase [Microvirga mediterraneensis]MBA1158923.1 ImmA/IrrE family metallo-endopeptidase [Microvirga mediterraneensis]
MSRRRAEIEQVAEEILREHVAGDGPTDPVQLANRMGVRIFNSKFSEPGIHGLIARRGGASTIYVDVDDRPVRKRFTVAHELGHFVLHLAAGEGEFIDDEDNFRTITDPDEPWNEERRREWEANVFAAAILMPSSVVRDRWPEIRDVDGMAEWFQVSRQAMALRLNQLGLIDQ